MSKSLKLKFHKNKLGKTRKSSVSPSKTSFHIKNGANGYSESQLKQLVSEIISCDNESTTKQKYKTTPQKSTGKSRETSTTPCKKSSRTRSDSKRYSNSADESQFKQSVSEEISIDDESSMNQSIESTSQKTTGKTYGGSISPSRRSKRTRNKPKKYKDFLEQTPSKQKVHNISSSDKDSSGEQNDKQSLQKPTALFGKDDVEGQDIFNFKIRHTKLDLQKKLQSSFSNSPELRETPMTTRRKLSFNNSSNIKCGETTPRHVKDVIRKRIVQALESDEEENDFSNSSSDFVPDKTDDESDSSSMATESSVESPKRSSKKLSIKTSIAKKIPKESKSCEYFITPDNYFMMNSGKKIITSDHTLARLNKFNIEDSDTDVYLSSEHKNKITELNESYHHLFDKWLFVLSEDFNIILYGIGSKRSILHQFRTTKLKEFNLPCIVVNGFFPSLSIKDILETIVIGHLENTKVPSNICEVVNLISTQLHEKNRNLFLIIHNIDGVMLRNAKAQATLASIAQIKNVHVIATIDHINAPLLWDNSKLSKFNFTWWDVSTFMPYTEETSYENSILAQRSGALQLSSLRSVYLSLTSNGKGILKIIIKYQLEHQKQAQYQGLPFKDLYSKCREQFLASSVLALRAQLIEFIDHKLVKCKRTDGNENLIIPIDNALLQQFLEQQDG